ncbi:lipase family protein [Nocardia brasiliensis]
MAATEPAPPADPFYDVPDDLAAARPGDILRSRVVQAKSLQLLPLNVQAWQLLYRSTDADGAPYAAVTTVMIPAGPSKPRPLLSFQAATDGTLRICNPSYGLTRGFPIEPSYPPGYVTIPAGAAEIVLAAAGLAQGWAVAMPDHGGVDNRFLTPRQPGYAVLDGIRAVEDFEPLALDGVNTPVGLWGYSGGGIASSWAAEMQPGYAPELDIRGVAMGAPERQLDASVRSANATPLGGLIPLSVAAIGKDDPDVQRQVDTYLTPEGRARVNETRNHCIAQNVLDNPWFDYHAALNQPLDVFLQDPVIRRAIDARGVTTETPIAPLYVYNGVDDEVSPVGAVDGLVQGYCDRGAEVTYRREEFPPRPLPALMTSHAVVVATGAPNAFAWLQQRLSLSPPPNAGCDVRTVPATLATPEALGVLGPAFIGNALLAALGFPIGTGR